MTIYKVRFERDYTIREGFDRWVEAESHGEALLIASKAAQFFNQDSPDDCSETGESSSTSYEIMGVPRTVSSLPPSGLEVLRRKDFP